jgi:carboxynorspermidine decarboxylase
MKQTLLSTVDSPALVYSLEEINRRCQLLQRGLNNTDAVMLYAVKACALESILHVLQPSVSGFAVASPAEAQMVSGAVRDSRTLHITTPGFRTEWLSGSHRYTHVAANSISQLERLLDARDPTASIGIRINPGLSNVEDERYDPSRRYSKLGVPIGEALDWFDRYGTERVEGVHFHNACLCESWVPLHDMVSRITSRLDGVLQEMKWINLGGGFVWDETTDFVPCQETVNDLSRRYGLEVFIEPGAGFINSAGCLVASVLDVFVRDGKTIAVLDTTVNHLPEVFEYQFEPDVSQHKDGGRHEYLLVGCSCLAGDIFGEYAFERPLEIGSRITFENVGAYTIVKANTFNGISLPSIYALSQSGELELIKESSLDDFVDRFGLRSNEYANS